MNLVYMIVGAAIFYFGYRTGQQTVKAARHDTAKQKNAFRNIYNDVSAFLKPDEDEEPKKKRKTPEDAEDEQYNKFYT